MNHLETKAGIEKLFKEAVQVLAAPAEQQVAVTVPGDVPAEVAEDYASWFAPYLLHFTDDLTQEASTCMHELNTLVSTLPDTAFQETNIASMQQPVWQPLRVKAQELLTLMNWPNELPKPFEKGSDSSYHRE